MAQISCKAHESQFRVYRPFFFPGWWGDFFIFHYFIRFHYWPKMRVEMEINATKKFSRKVGTRKVRKEPGFASKLWIYMFYKQKYMFPIAKTGENTDTLKIMNYFGIFENLTRVFLVSKKWRGRGTINSESTFMRSISFFIFAGTLNINKIQQLVLDSFV